MSQIISIIKWSKFHSHITFKNLNKEKHVGWTCAGNYSTHDGLVNGVKGFSKLQVNCLIHKSHLDFV